MAELSGDYGVDFDNFQTCVWESFSEWEAQFRKEVRQRKYSDLHGFVFDDESQGDAAIAQFERAEWLLETQVYFIKKMVAFELRYDPTDAMLDDIRRFLANQQIGAPKTAFTFSFWGNFPDGAASINVERWDDFVFADVWADQLFTAIRIDATRWKTWTDLRIRKVIDHIRENFADDGMRAKISVRKHSPEESAGSTLLLNCHVKDS